MKKYVIYAIIIVLVLVGIIASIMVNKNNTEDINKTAMTKVRLNEVTRSVFYAPQYVAIANGYFEEVRNRC